ncbi:MAG: flagellar biosynthesis protein FlhB [Rhizobiaceae bacterium]|nr:flagellar biosynthesis protein FlhB [Rhizobiaceae bacterium]
MADGEDKESKTEEASEKKIRDSLEKGQQPFAREAPLLASFIAILLFTMFFAEDSISRLGHFLSIFLEKPEDWPLQSAKDVSSILWVIFLELGRALGVLMVLLISGAIIASVLQNMPRAVLERIRPQFSRVSPRKGWERIFGVQGFVEFGKQLAKLIFAGLVLGIAMRESMASILSGMITHPVAFGVVIESIAKDIIMWIALAMIAIAGVDIIWSRYHWLADLRMTKQEVKDEMKQTVGDPLVRQRIRSLQRDRARKRMMAAVPGATLVIANPTHFAIALRYERSKDAAPVVVAKGMDLVALRIREIAEANGIPVFEDVTLARSMYKQVSVDSMIPPQFYQAVAELVRVVYARKPGQAQGRNN